MFIIKHILELIVNLYVNVTNLDLNCEPTYAYEEPQRTSTPTISENCQC